MPNKRNTTGLVFDRMDTIGDYLVVFDPHIPARHRRSLWEQVTKYQAEAQAYAEMAYLEYDAAEKLRLVRDARKYFRVFIRYWTKCCKTGEFRFGQANIMDIAERIEDVTAELDRWSAKLRRVSSGKAAAMPGAPGED